MIRLRILAALVGAVLAIPIFTAPAAAGFPTEINATPYSQIRDGCPYVSANWTVYLSGGSSGPYDVWVSYGDGTTSPHTYTYITSGISWGKTFATNCSIGIDYQQYWSASRAGGGTGHDYSWVYTN